MFPLEKGTHTPHPCFKLETEHETLVPRYPSVWYYSPLKEEAAQRWNEREGTRETDLRGLPSPERQWLQRITILGKTKQTPLDEKRKQINFTGISYKLFFNRCLKSESVAHLALSFNGLRLLAQVRACTTSDLCEESGSVTHHLHFAGISGSDTKQFKSQLAYLQRYRQWYRFWLVEKSS